jgi:hypothetical protein
MQQRYYDPSFGRFLSVDPLTAYENPVGAFNGYRYGNNNPYKFVDPDGRQVASPQALMRALNQGAHDAGELAKHKTDSVDVRLKAAAAGGLGVELDVSLMRGDGKVSLIPVGEGGFVGVMAQPRECYTASMPNAGDSPITFSGGPGVNAGGVLAVGVDTEVNPSGSIEVKPEVGIGLGEVAKFTPAVTIFNRGGQKPEPTPPPELPKPIERSR